VRPPRCTVRRHSHGSAYAPEVFETRIATKRVWATALERPHLRRALAVHVFFPEQAARRSAWASTPRPSWRPTGSQCRRRSDGWGQRRLSPLARPIHPVQKGLDLIVKAVASMPANLRPEVRLHGPDWRGQKERLRALVRELDVEHWIRIGEPIYGTRNGS